MREIAKILTVDKNGKDATDPAFDAANIVQWGFEPQRDDLRGMGAYFGAGTLAASDGKTAQIPDPWKAAWKDWYAGMWTDHVSMTGPIFQSPDINPEDYPFFTGKIGDEPQLPVVDLRPRGPQGRLGHGHRPVLQRQGRRRPSTPTRSGSSRTPSTPTRRSRS